MGINSHIEIIRDKNFPNQVEVILQGQFDKDKDVVSISIDANYGIHRQFKLVADGNHKMKMDEEDGVLKYVRYNKEDNSYTTYEFDTVNNKWTKNGKDIGMGMDSLDDWRVITRIKASDTKIDFKILNIDGTQVDKIKGITSLKALDQEKLATDEESKGLITRLTGAFSSSSRSKQRQFMSEEIKFEGDLAVLSTENNYKICLKRIENPPYRNNNQAKAEFKIVIMKDGKEVSGIPRQAINNSLKSYKIFDEKRQQIIDLDLDISTKKRDLSFSNASITIKSAKISELQAPSSAVSKAKAHDGSERDLSL